MSWLDPIGRTVPSPVRRYPCLKYRRPPSSHFASKHFFAFYMKTIPHHSFGFRFLVAATVMTLISSGCSPKGTSELASADKYFEAGTYELAEIQYKNVLQSRGQDAHAIGRLGIIYIEQGRLRQSIPYLLKARELTPENLDVRSKLGMIYTTLGKAKEAKEEAEFILSRQPNHPQAPSILVQASLATPEEIESAQTRLKQLPNASQANAPVLTARGIAELRLRNLSAAETNFRNAVSADPKFADAHMALGALYRAQNLNDKAEQAFKAAVEFAPLRSGNTVQYAQFKIQTGNIAAGRALLEELAKKVPDHLPPLAILAEIAATEKRYDDSAELVAKILAKEPAHPEASLLSSRLKLVRGNPAKAAEELEKLLILYPNWPQSLYFLGLAYSATGEQLKAVDRLTQAIRVSPMPEAILALAAINLRSGNFGAAVAGLKPFVEKHPNNIQGQLMLGEAYRAQGNTADALALYAGAESLFPTNPQIPFQTGLMLLRENKTAEARQAFHTALTRAPNFLPAWEQLVTMELVSKNYDAAVQRVDSELARNPRSAVAHLWAGRIYALKGEISRAESEFQKSIELHPEVSAAPLELARLYIASNQQKRALESLRAETERNPKSQNALLLTAMIQDQQKDYTAARQAYEKILILNPKSILALNNLAYLYSERFQELDKAHDLAQQARSLLPDEPHSADTFGWILYQQRHYARALSILEESAAALPSEAEVQYHLGMVRYMMGLEQPAKDALTRSLELNPEIAAAADIQKRLAILSIDTAKPSSSEIATIEKWVADSPTDPIALTRVGALYEGTGSTDKAVAAYKNAIQANGANAIPWLGLARVYLSRRDTKNAMEAAKTARKLSPNDDAVARIVGSIAYRAGDSIWASSLLQEVARRQPNDAELLFEMGQVLYSAGRFDDGRKTMVEALNAAARVSVEFEHTEDAKVFLEIIELTANPSSEGAQNKIQKVLQSNPHHAPALMALGAIYEYKFDYMAAQQAYEQALLHHPDLIPAKRKVAIMAAKTGAFSSQIYDWAVEARSSHPSDSTLTGAFGILTYLKGGDDARAIGLLKQSVESHPKEADLNYY
jgi:tetratricopeptide (TPR) repeat protein